MIFYTALGAPLMKDSHPNQFKHGNGLILTLSQVYLVGYL